MLNENIRAIRKVKGPSQEGLALRLQVVRQTVSKWGRGCRCRTPSLLVALSEALETPVSTLLGEDGRRGQAGRPAGDFRESGADQCAAHAAENRLAKGAA